MSKHINKLYFLISIILILVILFQYKIDDTRFLILFFNLFTVVIILFFMFVLAVTSIIINLIKNKKINFIPIFISLFAFIIIVFAPLTEMYVTIDYYLYHSKREDIIEMLYNAEQVNRNSYIYKLPEKYQSLSCDGEIVIENDYKNKIILFYTYRGIMDSFSGFIYVPNSYVLYDEVYGSEIIKKIKFNENWYWVACS